MFARKAQAQRLLNIWRARRSPNMTLLHGQSGQGKEILKEALHTRALDGEASVRTVWG